MMTMEMVMELLATAGNDLDVFGGDEFDNDISVEVNDFEGFDDDWSEIIRDIENPDLVDEIYETLKREALSVDEDFYVDFQFDGFSVSWGYASYNI